MTAQPPTPPGEPPTGIPTGVADRVRSGVRDRLPYGMSIKVLHSALLGLLLFAFTVATLFMVDTAHRVTPTGSAAQLARASGFDDGDRPRDGVAPGPRDGVAPGPSDGVAPGPHHRVLVLIVDGLRYETALDSTIMPRLHARRATGASGKVLTVFEGFTVPALQAAFTGTAETQLVNVVRNFRFGALPVESVFLDAQRMGKRTVIVGDEPFAQFGVHAERRLPARDHADKYQQDAERPGIALAAYADRGIDLAVCHYETTDWRAHEFGIQHPEYRRAFQAADSIIELFAAARAEGDYLLVMGDHGHNSAGEHKTGIDIPTFALLVGPDVRANHVFPALRIENMRLLVSHALGIPLHTASYQLATIQNFIPAVGGAGIAERAGVAGTVSDVDGGTVAGTLAGTVAGTVADTVAGPVSAGGGVARAGISERASNWLILLAFLGVGAALTRLILRGADISVAFLVVAAVLFGTEIALQHEWSPVFSIFPVAMLTVAVHRWREHRARSATLVLMAIFFATRWLPGADNTLTLRVPLGLMHLAPLYIAGIAARMFVMLQVTGRPRWRTALAVTTALTVISVRIWDVPAVQLGAIAVTCGVWLYLLRSGARATHAQTNAHRHIAAVTLVYLLFFYLVRLPIYQLFWADLWLAAVVLVARTSRVESKNAVGDNLSDQSFAMWFDVLIVSGAFTLSSLWLSTGLEWGSLYGLMPAYFLEQHVVWFLPVILLKIPLLMLLALSVLHRPPSGRLVAMALLCVWLRLLTAWVMRLGGAPGAAVWPVAEQAMYFVPFVVAALLMRALYAHSETETRIRSAA